MQHDKYIYKLNNGAVHVYTGHKPILVWGDNHKQNDSYSPLGTGMTLRMKIVVVVHCYSCSNYCHNPVLTAIIQRYLKLQRFQIPVNQAQQIIFEQAPGHGTRISPTFSTWTKILWIHWIRWVGKEHKTHTDWEIRLPNTPPRYSKSFPYCTAITKEITLCIIEPYIDFYAHRCWNSRSPWDTLFKMKSWNLAANFGHASDKITWPVSLIQVSAHKKYNGDQ